MAHLEGRCGRVEPLRCQPWKSYSSVTPRAPSSGPTKLTWVHEAEGESRAVAPRPRAAQGQVSTHTTDKAFAIGAFPHGRGS